MIAAVNEARSDSALLERVRHHSRDPEEECRQPAAERVPAVAQTHDGQDDREARQAAGDRRDPMEPEDLGEERAAYRIPHEPEGYRRNGELRLAVRPPRTSITGASRGT